MYTIYFSFYKQRLSRHALGPRSLVPYHNAQQHTLVIPSKLQLSSLSLTYIQFVETRTAISKFVFRTTLIQSNKTTSHDIGCSYRGTIMLGYIHADHASNKQTRHKSTDNNVHFLYWLKVRYYFSQILRSHLRQQLRCRRPCSKIHSERWRLGAPRVNRPCSTIYSTPMQRTADISTTSK